MTHTLLFAECIFSKYIFFCNGELQVVSVSQAQKCTKGCSHQEADMPDYLCVPFFK